MRITPKYLTGILPIFFHELGFERFVNLSSQASTGTNMQENINVQTIPRTSVIPTVLIGTIGTILLTVRTPKPIIVVTAERSTAFPVVLIDSITASLNRSASQLSGICSSGFPSCLDL